MIELDPNRADSSAPKKSDRYWSSTLDVVEQRTTKATAQRRSARIATATGFVPVDVVALDGCAVERRNFYEFVVCTDKQFRTSDRGYLGIDDKVRNRESGRFRRVGIFFAKVCADDRMRVIDDSYRVVALEAAHEIKKLSTADVIRIR